MIENQDVEFKSTLKNEWLEWICGMANASGGVIDEINTSIKMETVDIQISIFLMIKCFILMLLMIMT